MAGIQMGAATLALILCVVFATAENSSTVITSRTTTTFESSTTTDTFWSSTTTTFQAPAKCGDKDGGGEVDPVTDSQCGAGFVYRGTTVDDSACTENPCAVNLVGQDDHGTCCVAEPPNAPASGGTCTDPDPSTTGEADYICPSGYEEKTGVDGGACFSVTECNTNCCQAVAPTPAPVIPATVISGQVGVAVEDADAILSDRDGLGAKFLKGFKEYIIEKIDQVGIDASCGCVDAVLVNVRRRLQAQLRRLGAGTLSVEYTVEVADTMANANTIADGVKANIATATSDLDAMKTELGEKLTASMGDDAPKITAVTEEQAPATSRQDPATPAPATTTVAEEIQTDGAPATVVCGMVAFLLAAFWVM